MAPAGPPGAYQRPHGAPAAPAPAWRLGDEEEIQAVLLVDAGHAALAAQELGRQAASQSRPDGSVEFTVAVTNRVAFRSYVLGFLEHAEVIGPPALRRDMTSYLEDLAGANRT